MALTHRADRFALAFPLCGMTVQTRVSNWSQRKAAENGQGVTARKVKLMYYWWNNLHKIHKQEWSIQCLSEHGKIIGKIEEGFRDVGTVSKSGHHPIIYCPPPTDPLRCIRSEEGLWSGSNFISCGQSRIGFIILSLGKCLLFFYLVYMTKISFRYVHYKELRLLAPFENSCVLQWINNEFPPKELFFFPSSKASMLKGSSWHSVYSSSHNEV